MSSARGRPLRFLERKQRQLAGAVQITIAVFVMDRERFGREPPKRRASRSIRARLGLGQVDDLHARWPPLPRTAVHDGARARAGRAPRPSRRRCVMRRRAGSRFPRATGRVRDRLSALVRSRRAHRRGRARAPRSQSRHASCPPRVSSTARAMTAASDTRSSRLCSSTGSSGRGSPLRRKRKNRAGISNPPTSPDCGSR